MHSHTSPPSTHPSPTNTPIEVPMRASDQRHHFVRRDVRHGHIAQDALVVKVYADGITDDVSTLCCVCECVCVCHGVCVCGVCVCVVYVVC